MKHSIAARVAVCMLAPAILGTSASALAASDVKSFSTNVCVPVGAAASNDLTYSHLGLLNTSTTSSRVVICPLVKDTDLEWTAGLTNLNVEYRSPAGAGGAVSCTIYVGSIASGSWSQAASPAALPAGTTGYILLAPETAASWWNEPVNLACSLGPRMRLTRIYLTETGVTNTP
jgi:hypothetical protein